MLRSTRKAGGDGGGAAPPPTGERQIHFGDPGVHVAQTGTDAPAERPAHRNDGAAHGATTDTVRKTDVAASPVQSVAEYVMMKGAAVTLAVLMAATAAPAPSAIDAVTGTGRADPGFQAAAPAST